MLFRSMLAAYDAIAAGSAVREARAREREAVHRAGDAEERCAARSRCLTALLSLGVLAGGLWLRYPWSRVVLVAAAIPVAVVLNGIRVFLTGFLVYFVGPEFGDGFMHVTEGWLVFVIAFGLLGGLAWLLGVVERRLRARWPIA